MVSPKYLLDTNALSEPATAVPNRKFLEKFERHADELAMASVTWHEALYGAHLLPDGKRKRAVLAYLDALTLPILSYDALAAQWFAVERARLRKKGKTVPYGDGQIAATAAVNRLTLVTANLKDFVVFEGLSLTSWMD